MYRLVGKRLLDLALTVPAVLVLSPVFAIVASVVRAKLGSPVLFRQRRPGLHGRIFTIYKFRTMIDAYGADGRHLSDSDRLTPLGSFLRASSLDELPELFNVLRGDMSLVGPRPLLVQYLSRYTPEQMRRHDVLPGITGLAQVEGRNALTWDEKFDWDLEYVRRQSLRLDLNIIARTVQKIIRREGISQPGHATAEEFTGSESSP
jgi:sugar transferase EpsL